MKRTFSFMLFLWAMIWQSVLVSTLKAQMFSPLSVNYIAPASFPDAPDTDLSITRISAGFAQVFDLSNSGLITGIRYNHVRFDYKQGQITSLETDNLHQISLIAGVRFDLKNNWQTTVLLTPGLSSDFASSPGPAASFQEKVSFSTTVLFSKTRTANQVWGLGANYQLNRSPLFLPVVQFMWQGSGPASAEIIAPSTAHLWYDFGALPTIGVAWRTIFTAYGIQGRGPRIPADLLHQQVFTLGPAMRIPVAGPVTIQVEGGYTLRNRLQFDAEDVRLDYDNNLFIWAGLVLITN